MACALAAAPEAMADVQLIGCSYGSSIPGKKSGIYKISTTSPEMTLINENPQATGGGVYGNGKYYCQWYMSMFGTEVWTNMCYSVDTWEMTGGIGSRDTWAYDLAFEDATGRIYGCFHDPDENYEGRRLVFGWIDADDYTTDYATVNPVADVFVNMAGMDFDSTGQLWAISREGLLFKVDKETGEMTQTADTGLSGYYNTSATIDRLTDTMYYFLQLKGGTSPGVSEDTTTLYKINLATGSATKVYDLPGAESIQGLSIFVAQAADTAPAAATGLGHSFAEGNLSGKISFTMPSKTYGGGDLAGQGTYKVAYRPYDDAQAVPVQLAQGSAAYGSAVEADVTLPANGQYTFIVTIANTQGEESPRALTDTYVGFDTPLPPSEVTAEKSADGVHLSWTAPTSTMHNGYLDAANLRYNVVRMPGEVTVATGITALEFDDVIPDATDHVRYTYNVTADNHGMVSMPRPSNVIAVGPFTVPYLCEFADQDEFNEFTVLTKEASPDNIYHWEYHTGYKAAHLSNGRLADDDWLITPAISMLGGITYEVTIEIGNNDNNYPALFHVGAGSEPTRAGMAQFALLGNTEVAVKRPGFTTVKARFTPLTDGSYHVGIHSITPAANWDDMYVYKIGIEQVTPTGIDSVTTDDGTAEYYSIDGRRLSAESARGLVIVRKNGKSTKIFRK